MKPTNIPRGFHVETMRKRPFPRRFNVESTWFVCRELDEIDTRLTKNEIIKGF